MSFHNRLARATLLCGLLVGLSFPCAAQIDVAHAIRNSDIVFVGTVSLLGTASMYGVPTSDSTLVVEVDSVLDQSRPVIIMAGDSVTVKVLDPSAFRPGLQATFYTQAWIFGDGVAVREVAHEEVTVANASVSIGQGTTVGQLRQQVQDDQLRARIEAADMVVVGSVVSVGPATISAFQTQSPPISEHTANWQEATIQVGSAIKGAQDNQRIVIRFPNSMDVQWFEAPRFEVGQQGVFICTRDQVSGTALAMMGGDQVTAYTALNSMDVLSADQADRVRALIRP